MLSWVSLRTRFCHTWDLVLWLVQRNRFHTLVLALLLAAFAAATVQCTAASPAPQEVPDGPPNIIVILADDLGYADVGFNGPSEAQTPNLDRLASEGIRFTDGYVASPLCSPSRAALLTGRNPARYGWEINPAYNPLDHHLGLDKNETLFPERLQDAGHHTGIIGKWHLGSAYPFNPLARGFDYFYRFVHGGHDYLRINALQMDQPYAAPLVRRQHTASFSGYLTDALTDDAIGFVKADRDSPFFLYLSYNAPHTPLQAPPWLVSKYGHIQDENRRVYLAMVDSLDQNVGRLLEALDDTGLRDNTIVFFLSDNGGTKETGSNAPFRGHKSSISGGGIRVPFVASWPARWPQGVTYEPMVSSTDIAATGLALAGGVVTDPDRPLDGENERRQELLESRPVYQMEVD